MTATTSASTSSATKGPTPTPRSTAHARVCAGGTRFTTSTPSSIRPTAAISPAPSPRKMRATTPVQLPGIYVDGGADITIERNTVHACNMGVSIGSGTAGKSPTTCAAGTTCCATTTSADLPRRRIHWQRRHDQHDRHEQHALPERQRGMGRRQRGHPAFRLLDDDQEQPLPSQSRRLGMGPVHPQDQHGRLLRRQRHQLEPLHRRHRRQQPGVHLEQHGEQLLSAWKTNSAQDANSTFTTASLGFTNAAANDFTLLSTSIARDNGDTAFVSRQDGARKTWRPEPRRQCARGHRHG